MRPPRRSKFIYCIILLLSLILALMLLVQRQSYKQVENAISAVDESESKDFFDSMYLWKSMEEVFSTEQHENLRQGKPWIMKAYHGEMLRTTSVANHARKYNVTSDPGYHFTSSFPPSNNHQLHIREMSTSKTNLQNNTSRAPPLKLTSDLVLRSRTVERQCDRLSVFKTVNSAVHPIMTNRKSGLAYCYLPKCGCTFWKRILRFLNNDFTDKNITSPFQIRRIETHNWKIKNPATFVPFHVYQRISSIYQSFMFVREPYSRLWSAYVDKFYLPDFWMEFHNMINYHRAPASIRHCTSDVTFQEFVGLSLKTQEPHWDPMHKMCDPCAFRPSYIGRVESFSSDSRYILKMANLSWILDGYDHGRQMQEELVTLINYNFELFSVKRYVQRCISRIGMFGRLWKAFQINGYLPADAQMPPLNNSSPIPEFTRIVLDQYRKRPKSPDVLRRQRKEFMINAYKTLSTATMNDIRMKYARDFLLFNYDPRPAELYSYRH